MDEAKVREWLDKIADAQTVINENVFMDKEIRYDGPVICDIGSIQLLSGGWVNKIAKLLKLEVVAKPFDDDTITYSFVYRGIVFLALERLASNDDGTDRE